MKGVNRVMGG